MSVYSTLVTSVPVWGRDIQKIECANHCCKCYRGALERLVQDNPSYKGAGKLTKKMRQKLVSAARCAIKMRSKYQDRAKARKLLEKDLLNVCSLRSWTIPWILKGDKETTVSHTDSGLCVTNCGLFVSLQNPWLAATPDGIVQDLSEHPNSICLLEIKNPYSKKSMTISEACSSGSSFCLQQEKEETAFKLKRKHEYFYQIQCRLYCVNKDWCDFVVRTEKDLHVERVYRDREWWSEQLPKLKLFYYDALLPELANPRHDKGGGG